jgi:hypothetical protein
MERRSSLLVRLAGAAAGLASILALVVAACDMKSDANLPEAGPPECPGCPPDPNRGQPSDICSVQDGLDRLLIESFDNHQLSITGAAGINSFGAQDLYSYTDGTAAVRVEAFYHDAVQVGDDDAGLHAPVDVVSGNYISGYELPITTHQPCDLPYDAGSSFQPGVLHIFGGQFRAWGGGVGISMAKLNGRETVLGNVDQHPTDDPRAPKNVCCFNAPRSSTNTQPCVPHPDPKFSSICPAADAEFAVNVGAVDVSQYEGVSFWARRGPNSQNGIRINVGDKHTDDDLNYLAQRQQAATGQPQALYCQRLRECDCRLGQSCTNYALSELVDSKGKPLQNYISGSYCRKPTNSQPNNYSYCAAPGLDLGGGNSISGSGPSNCCDVTACNSPYSAYPTDPLPMTGRFAAFGGAVGDPQFYGRACTPFGWVNGISGSWCYDPGVDPDPAASSELCGDHWMKAVDVGAKWQFYYVPFTDLRQQGWAKRSEKLDLQSVSTIRFTWDVGFIDYWIDEVAFYRRKNQ